MRKETHASGFTLTEVIIALSLMCLLFIGGLALFVLSIQLSVKTHGVTAATADANVAAQRVADDAHHALWIALPSDAATYFTQPTGTSAVSFQTTSQSQTVDTAVEIVFPPTGAITVSTSASATAAVTIADRSSAAAGGVLWVYRSDTVGEPNAAGTCLWMKGSEQGVTVNQAILKSIDATEADAIQFSRVRNALAPSSILPYQMAIKIISAYYSPIGTSQKSDSTVGAQVSALNGRAVEMRDHEGGLDHQGYSSTVNTTTSSPWLSN